MEELFERLNQSNNPCGYPAEENTEEENNGEEVEKDNPDTDITQVVDQNK